MPRHMSFSITTQQYRQQTKTVTRRLGWRNIRVGEIQLGVEKAMGLKRGERMVVLGRHRISGTRWEPLRAITPDDVLKEGFPDLTPAEFIEMFCRTNRGCTPDTLVNRIEFEYLKD